MEEQYQEQLSPEEEAQLLAYSDEIRAGYPTQEEKANMFSIFKRVITATDTSKVANLEAIELYVARNAQATSLALKKAFNYPLVADYFKAKAEIVLATSLSKTGFLVEQFVTQKRQLSTEKKKPLGDRKPWLKKK